jgi:hypothetical protein
MARVKKSEKRLRNMMNNRVVEKRVLYSLDLTQIESDGSLTCPKCGTMISPDDETEEVYIIVDTKVHNDELVELLIKCRTCGTHINLTGFQQPVEDIANE